MNWQRLALVVMGFSTLMAVGQSQTPVASIPPDPQSNVVSVVASTNHLEIAATSQPATNVLSAAEVAHRKYVRETIARLMTLERNSDPASLAAILVELKNPDKKIRTAALSSVIQFNDRSVIPALQKIADQTEDPFEKVEILKAIDVVKMPSLTEFMAYQRAQKEAKRKTIAPAILLMATNAPPAVTNAAAHP